jgi:hypothetical protein
MPPATATARWRRTGKPRRTRSAARARCVCRGGRRSCCTVLPLTEAEPRLSRSLRPIARHSRSAAHTVRTLDRTSAAPPDPARTDCADCGSDGTEGSGTSQGTRSSSRGRAAPAAAACVFASLLSCQSRCRRCRCWTCARRHRHRSAGASAASAAPAAVSSQTAVSVPAPSAANLPRAR